MVSSAKSKAPFHVAGVARNDLLALLAFLVALAATGVLGAYHLTILNFVLLRAIVVLGLVLLTGYTGQISFGQAAFVGIGAYTSAILTTRYDISPWLALIAAMLLVGVLAALVGLPLLQLEGHYLALGTLAFGLIVYTGMLEWHSLTGGPSGFSGIPAFSILGITFDTPRANAYLLVVITALVTWVARNVAHGRISRQARAVRDSQITAECLGVGTASLKLRMFVLAAVFAALSGGLYVHLIRFVNPAPFDFLYSVELLTMAVVGGLTSIWGGLLGAAVLTVLTEALRSAVPGATGEVQLVLFGALLVVMLIFWPSGLAGGITRAYHWITTQMRGRSNSAGTESPALPRVAETIPDWLTQSMKGSPSGVAGEPLLRVAGLTCRFGGLVALRQLDLTVPSNRLLAVIGPNGAGKTTLFNVISGLLAPTSGTVEFAGHQIGGTRPAPIARLGVARTFQNVEVFPRMTCLENVLVALEAEQGPGVLASMIRLPRVRAVERELEEQASDLLRFVGLADHASTLAGDLPLGQQRALELARAMAQRPRLLLLDEPASGLNPSERAELARLIRTLRELGIAIMLVEHDMEFVMNLADEIAVLNYGEKIAEGPPATIQRDPAVIAAYLGDTLDDGQIQQTNPGLKGIGA